jgi:transcriptional regulator with XRE-family HTH domain
MSSETPGINALLRRLREDSGVSLRGAATEIGLAPSFLSRVERGERTITSDLRRRLANYYSVDEESLELASGQIPNDVVAILRQHPDVIDDLRKRYGSDASADTSI